MHTDNAYLHCFQSNFLCSSIHILCRSSYIEKLYRLSDNLSIRFASDFRLEAFNYKQVSALSSIALLRCIIMNFLVLALLFDLLFDIDDLQIRDDFLYFFLSLI